MNGSEAALYDGSRGQVPEPVFQDVPFDESEWRALYDILRQVNQPKAELMRVQYEVVRTAYQHYMSARAEERNAYAMQRADDEAYNRAVAEQRLAVEAQIREVRERAGAAAQRAGAGASGGVPTGRRGRDEPARRRVSGHRAGRCGTQ
jgi:hypothetical protein